MTQQQQYVINKTLQQLVKQSQKQAQRATGKEVGETGTSYDRNSTQLEDEEDDRSPTTVEQVQNLQNQIAQAQQSTNMFDSMMQNYSMNMQTNNQASYIQTPQKASHRGDMNTDEQDFVEL